MKFLQVLVLILGLVMFVNSQTNSDAVLSGSIYDATGALIVKASVVAINEKGQKFDAATNDDGIYVLNLPFNVYRAGDSNFRIAKYEIIVDTVGFEKKSIKDFSFAPSSKGKMQLDFALNVKTYVDPE